MDDSKYLEDHLQETLNVVDTCLSTIYAGKTHMYRALAGQLRLLLCDKRNRKDNSLIGAVFPKLEVSGLQGIIWSDTSASNIQLCQPQVGYARISMMPFEITVYENGLAVADLLLNKDLFVPIQEWAYQRVTVIHPTDLTVEKIIRAVADKGGGAHVDAGSSVELRYMYQQAPVGRTYAEMFILSLGRFVQMLGENLFNYVGARVPDELLQSTQHKLNLLVAAHQELVQALTLGSSGQPKA